MICFNNHNREDVWDAAEWDFFMTDLTRHLKPHGRIWFELNRQHDGTFLTPAAEEMLRRRGAAIDEHKVIFERPPTASADALPVAAAAR
jgi:hypothetical protein